MFLKLDFLPEVWCFIDGDKNVIKLLHQNF